MKTINLKKIVEASDLSKKEIANHLFPDNKFPVLALDRVARNDAVLDANQISRLSAVTGISIGDLFGEWKMESKTGFHKLSSGEYQAEIDSAKMILHIFHNKSLFHEEVIYDDKVTISELINILNIQIENYESN